MPSNLNFYESEVRSILGLPPSWLLWSANYLILMLLALILFLGLVIPIQERVPVEAQLDLQAELTLITSTQEGTISSIYNSDRSMVKKNDPLFTLDAQDQKVHSPIEGMLVFLQNLEPGAEVDSGEVCLGIVPFSKEAKVQVIVPIKYLHNLNIEQQVVISSELSPELYGSIQHIYPNPETKSIRLTLEVKGNPSQLMFSEHIALHLLKGEENIIQNIFRI